MSNIASAPMNPLAVLPPEKKAPRLYTLAEYLHREEHAKERHEYYDGIIKKLPMARGSHNLIITNLTFQLESFIFSQEKDYFVMNNSQLVYSKKLNITLYPDILVISEKPVYHDQNEVLLINPILIIEVLSRSTRVYDRKEKFNEYKTLESFKEYVLIDQNKCFIETRFKEKPNTWKETTYTDLKESVVLNSINLTIDVAKIYRRIELK